MVNGPISALESIQPQAGLPPSGLAGSEAALQAGLGGALSALQTGAGAGTATLSPFVGGGQQAFNLQSALSGAGGPQAQQQAFANFRASPGQAFLQREGERALLRNQGAIGGLGGGNVRRELQRQGIGLAQQDFGNQFNRLGQVAGLGGQLAGQLAGQQFGAGGQASNLAFGTGQALAGGRERAGQRIAEAIGGTSTGLANLASQQGRGLSDIIGQGGGNLANLLTGAGTAQGLSQQQLAALLANISTGSASQIAGLPSLPGVQQTPSRVSDIGNIISGIGGLF